MNNSRATKDMYEAEKILDDRMHRGKKQYLVKWAGCPDNESTWEFKSNFLCEQLLQEYEREKHVFTRKNGRAVSENPANIIKPEFGSLQQTAQPQERTVLIETESGLMEVLIPGKQAKFEQGITNEWHDAVKNVTGAYINERGVLEIEFITVSGQKATCSGSEMRYKAPFRLLDFYEENLDFSE